MTEPLYSDANSKKIMAGIFGILLGALGIHKFILGYTTEGIIYLLITFLTCGIGAGVMQIIGLVEEILERQVLDLMSDTTLETARTGVIVILAQRS